MISLALYFLVAATTLPADSGAITPTPFTASYSVSYRGLNAGRLHFKLRAEKPGLFVYETRAEPSLLARFVVGENALERSIMRIDRQGVRPLSWSVEDGKSGNKGDGSLQFAWNGERVSGTVKGERLELPTVPGLQDRLSVQIAVMTAMLRGGEPGIIPLLGDNKIRRYTYTRVGIGRIRTPAGEFDTILYEGTRPGSHRLSRFWHAPALGYIPVRAEQVRDGKIETILELVTVHRTKGG